MFETDLYPVNEDVGSLSYRLTASSTASFPYQVTVTAVDGSARCEYVHGRGVTLTLLWAAIQYACTYECTVWITGRSLF